MKTTAELLTLINTNVADNTTGAITPANVREVVNLLVGDTLSGQLVRDSQGANTGGLFGTTSSNGWVIAPSALAVITRIEGVV